MSWVFPSDGRRTSGCVSLSGVGSLRKQACGRHYYDLDTKLRAVEFCEAGQRVDDIARKCGVHSETSVYVWAQKYRVEGMWALMSQK